MCSKTSRRVIPNQYAHRRGNLFSSKGKDFQALRGTRIATPVTSVTYFAMTDIGFVYNLPRRGISLSAAFLSLTTYDKGIRG